MKKLLVSLILLLSPALAFAQGALSGYVQQGGQTVSVAGFQSSTKVQKSYPSSTVTVYLAGTVTLASIYSNSSGTAKANPFTAGTDGSWLFYADVCVDVKFSGTGITVPFTYSSLCPTGTASFFILAPAPSGGDDYATIQALINTYNPLGIRVRLRKGVYLTSAEIQLLNTPSGLDGAGIVYGSTATTIRATAAMRSVVFVESGYNLTISDLQVDGNQLATSAIYLHATSIGKFQRVYAYNAVVDGWYMNDFGGAVNDTSYFEQCWASDNGTIYTTNGISGQYTRRKSVVAGTAGIINGNATVTITGGPNLTTLGFRKGDILRVGSTIANSYYGLISSVTATTIIMESSGSNLPTSTTSGLDYAIGLGDGLHEAPGNNNSINTIAGGLWRSNAGVGLRLTGPYGDTVIAPQFDGNGFFSISAGQLDGSPMFGLKVTRPYTENDGVRATYFLGNVQDAQLDVGVSPSTVYLPVNSPATGIVYGPYGEELVFSGARNNFVLQVKNNAGQLQVRFLADIIGLWGAFQVPSLVNAPTSYTNLPTVDAVTGFGVVGAGFLSGGTQIVLNTASTQQVQIDANAVIESEDTGAVHTIVLTTVSSNVNGTTLNRLALLLYLNGVDVGWGSLAAGKSVAVRFDGRLKK